MSFPHFLSIEYSVVVLGDSSLSGKIVGYVAGRKEIAPSDRSVHYHDNAGYKKGDIMVGVEKHLHTHSYIA